jgi:phage baseplate assembly protein W
MSLARSDYAFPLRIAADTRQTARTAYASHVEQMIEQVLLTAPGERLNLPQFGCGLRKLLFAPIDESLTAALKIQVMQALGEWLSGVIEVSEVEVGSSSGDAALEPGTAQITVSYKLIETQTSERKTVKLL